MLKVPEHYVQEKLTVKPLPKDAVSPGDFVYFSEYAPFSAFPDFPEIQLIHADDIIMKLKELPEDVVDD